MTKVNVVIIVLLASLTGSLAFRLRENSREDARVNMLLQDEANNSPREMLLKRGVVPDDTGDEEAYLGTAFLLDAILADEATVQGGKVEYRFGSGKKAECINGGKIINANCRWTGQVLWPGESKPKETKLTVMDKYCRQARLGKPAPKLLFC